MAEELSQKYLERLDRCKEIRQFIVMSGWFGLFFSRLTLRDGGSKDSARGCLKDLFG